MKAAADEAARVALSSPPTRGRRSGSLLGRVVDGRTITGVAMRWEGVRCECADPVCTCAAGCTALACYEWGSVDEADWQYLCHRCAQRMVERGIGPNRTTGDEDEEGKNEAPD